MKKIALGFGIVALVLLAYAIFRSTSEEKGILRIQWKDNVCSGKLTKEDGTSEEKTGESGVSFDKVNNTWIAACQFQGGSMSLQIFNPSRNISGSYPLEDLYTNNRLPDTASIVGFGFSTIHYEKQGYQGIVLKKIVTTSGMVDVKKLPEDGKNFPLEIIADAQVRLFVPEK